jgi:hypothetical protein
MQNHADPDPDRTSKSQDGFLHEKYTKKPYLRRYESLFERQETRFICIIGQFHAPGSGSIFPIRIRTQDSQMYAVHADPDP